MKREARRRVGGEAAEQLLLMCSDDRRCRGRMIIKSMSVCVCLCVRDAKSNQMALEDNINRKDRKKDQKPIRTESDATRNNRF